MKDEALQIAIKHVGSQAELANRIGTTQPTVSRWERVPAEFVLPIEKATNGAVTRHQLRPDLYPEDTPQAENASIKKQAP